MKVNKIMIFFFHSRFFFTHDNVGDVGFCPSDLEIIRKRTLRDIICTCSNVESLPKSVFHIPSDANPKGIHIRFAIFLSLLNFNLVHILLTFSGLRAYVLILEQQMALQLFEL